VASETNKSPAPAIPIGMRSQIPKARLHLSRLQDRSSSLRPLESPVVLAALEGLEDALHELELTCEYSQTLLERCAAAEAALELAHQRSLALFSGAPVPYVMTDLQGVILEANTAASELLHVSPRWLRNKPLDLYVDERGLFAQILAHQSDSHAFCEPLELTIRPRERARIAVLARFKRFEGASGDPELWWVFLRASALDSR
jgi:PAS domain-containing protein